MLLEKTAFTHKHTFAFCHAGNDLLEYSPYEPVNSRLSDIFRLAPIIAGKNLFLHSWGFTLDAVQY